MLWFCGLKKSTFSSELWWWDGHTSAKYPKKTWLTLTKMTLSTGYCEWGPTGTHHQLRRGQRPRWRDAPPVSNSRQTSEKMPCAVSRLALVCVSLCPYCQLMHLSMHHFCLSVWRRDNAEPPREAACISYCGSLFLAYFGRGELRAVWVSG